MKTRSRTFDLNTLRVSGKPISYFFTPGKDFNVKVVIQTDDGTKIKIACPIDDQKKPYFSEEEFKAAGVVSFLDVCFSSYMSNTDNRPRFELKLSNNKMMLLGVDLKENQAIVGGIVSLVNPTSRKIMIDVSFRKGFPKPGQKQEYGVRQVMVACPDDVDLPTKGNEIIAIGSAMVSESGAVGLKAAKLTNL